MEVLRLMLFATACMLPGMQAFKAVRIHRGVALFNATVLKHLELQESYPPVGSTPMSVYLTRIAGGLPAGQRLVRQEVTTDVDGVKRVVYAQQDGNRVPVLGATVMAFFKPPTAPAPYAVVGAVYPGVAPDTSSLAPVAQATAVLQSTLAAALPTGAHLGPIAQRALVTDPAVAKPDTVIVPAAQGAVVVYKYGLPDNKANWEVMVDAQSTQIVQVYNNRRTMGPARKFLQQVQPAADEVTAVAAQLAAQSADAPQPVSGDAPPVPQEPTEFEDDVDKADLAAAVHDMAHAVADASAATVDASVVAAATCAAAANATGKSLYSGLVYIPTSKNSATSYGLTDPSRLCSGVKNMGNAKIEPSGYMTDADNVWGNSQKTDAGSAAVDAAYVMALCYDYYLKVQGRNGINGKGKATKSRVHFDKSYDNAYWDDFCYCMTYGDGSNTGSQCSSTSGCLPLVSIDVGAHEMQHGVTAATANLVYSGESGGLNEALSDIMAITIWDWGRNYWGPTVKTNIPPVNWFMGSYLWPASCNTPTVKNYIRNLKNPKADGKSANCWNSTLNSLDVHYTSGPANRAFWLMARGTCCGSNLAANQCMGIQDAGWIWYRAVTKYMTASTIYSSALSAVGLAAKDLDTAKPVAAGIPTRYNQVVSAFKAIGIGGTCNSTLANACP